MKKTRGILSLQSLPTDTLEVIGRYVNPVDLALLPTWSKSYRSEWAPVLERRRKEIEHEFERRKLVPFRAQLCDKWNRWTVSTVDGTKDLAQPLVHSPDGWQRMICRADRFIRIVTVQVKVVEALQTVIHRMESQRGHWFRPEIVCTSLVLDSLRFIDSPLSTTHLLAELKTLDDYFLRCHIMTDTLNVLRDRVWEEPVDWDVTQSSIVLFVQHVTKICSISNDIKTSSAPGTQWSKVILQATEASVQYHFNVMYSLVYLMYLSEEERTLDARLDALTGRQMEEEWTNVRIRVPPLP